MYPKFLYCIVCSKYYINNTKAMDANANIWDKLIYQSFKVAILFVYVLVNQSIGL
jgi:hypothetical protein